MTINGLVVALLATALPEPKIAHFYQLENKLDAITNFALARQIPLVPTSAPPARQ